jgi:nucleotide-binding universal stress UspA family protein
MIRSILVPLDGSAFGEQALPLAVSLAKRSGAKLQIVHKHIPLPPIHPDSILAQDLMIDPKIREQERVYLDAIIGRLGKIDGVPASAQLVEGPLVESLVENAIGAGVDLIVMTTHGRGPVSRFWLGSVADVLIRRSPIPILLVRPYEDEDVPRPVPVLKNMVIPLDGSPHAEAILPPALALGQLTDAHYTLLRVVVPIPPSDFRLYDFGPNAGEGSLERMECEARQYLESVATRWRGQTTNLRTRLVIHPQPVAAILDQVSDPVQDMIAIETHGRGGLSRLLLGSVADKVIRGSSTPILIHRNPGK